MGKRRVLFICTHNAARSQMAEGLMKHMYGDYYEVFSGGTEPSVLNPYAVKTMQEIGIDISHHYAKSIDEFLDEKFDYVITVCDQAKDSCPFFPGAKNYIHKGFTDPSRFKGREDEILSQIRKVRDEIKDWIKQVFDPRHMKSSS